MRLNNYELPTQNFLSRVSYKIANESLAGDTSSTDSTHKGIKPKKINVSFQIDFKKSTTLTDIVKLSESTNSNGLTVYTIVDNTANAMGIRQVIFDGQVSCQKDGEFNAWNISFVLSEKISSSEKAGQKEADIAINEQSFISQQKNNALFTVDSLNPLSGFAAIAEKVNETLS